MTDQVRILLRDDDGGAFAVSGFGRPEDFAPQIARFHSADLAFDGVVPAGAGELLVFTPVAPSPLGTALIREAHDVLLLLAYHTPDDDAMLAFDAGITDEYSRFYATRGVHYTGAFRVDGLGGGRLGEILCIDGVASVEEAERLCSEDLPPRIVEIEDECRTYQDREASRFLLWLQPKP